MKARVIGVSLLLLLVFSGVRAAELNPSLQTLGALSRFMADLQLFMYEPENSEFHDSASVSWGQLQQQYRAWLPTIDADQQTAVATTWQEMVAVVEGDGYYDGLLASGFDTALNASLRSHVEDIRVVLLKQPSMAASQLTPLQALWARHYRTLAGYMLVATTPLGGMSVGAEDMDLSPPYMVKETDVAWERALAAASAEQRPALVRGQRRWEFVRETVLNAAQRSLPYVVNTQMTSIIRDIERLMEE